MNFGDMVNESDYEEFRGVISLFDLGEKVRRTLVCIAAHVKEKCQKVTNNYLKK